MNSSASFLIFWRIYAEICCGVYSLSLILYLKSVPIFRFAAWIVPVGLLTACRLAGSPTRRAPSLLKATTEGNAFPYWVVPSALGIIVGFPACNTAAAELLVPRSIPIIFSFLLDFFSSFLASFFVILFSPYLFLCFFLSFLSVNSE